MKQLDLEAEIAVSTAKLAELKAPDQKSSSQGPRKGRNYYFVKEKIVC